MTDSDHYVFDESNFQAITYGATPIYFESSSNFKEVIAHKRKIKAFKYHKNLLEFLASNPGIKIYFTLNPQIKNFEKHGKALVVNFSDYSNFCFNIEARTAGRAQAFFGSHVRAEQLLNDDDKASFIRANASEEQLIQAIQLFPPNAQEKMLKALQSVSTPNGTPPPIPAMPNSSVGKDELISAMAKFLSDNDVQEAFFKNVPRLQIETLKSLVDFLEKNLDKNESFIQDWIDEESGKHRKKRCLIFGIEYVDPKREGFLQKKRFDVLAEQNRNAHVIIELKSPNADVFKVDKTPNGNGGYQTTYNLSPDLSRAWPQVLGYQQWYEEASPEELEAIGITERKKISKCIIVIGKTQDNAVWRENFHRLKSSLSGIEIWTYTDLIDKLKNTIANLEESC